MAGSLASALAVVLAPLCGAQEEPTALQRFWELRARVVPSAGDTSGDALDAAVDDLFAELEVLRDDVGVPESDVAFSMAVRVLIEHGHAVGDEADDLLEEALGVLHENDESVQGNSPESLESALLAYAAQRDYSGGRLEGARRRVEAALSLEGVSPSYQLILLDLRVVIALTEADYPSAIRWLRRLDALADRHYESLGAFSEPWIVSPLRWVALALHLGAPDLARRSFDEARRRVDQNGSRLEGVDRLRAMTVHAEARVLSLEGRRERALARLDEALADPRILALGGGEPERLRAQRASLCAALGRADAESELRALVDGLSEEGRARSLWEPELLRAEIQLVDHCLDVDAVTEARRWLDDARERLDHWEHAALGARLPLTDRLHWACAVGRWMRAAHSPPDELDAHRQELSDLLRELLARWSEVPDRPGGIGFLHSSLRRRAFREWMDLGLAGTDAEAVPRESLAWLLDVQERGSFERTLPPRGPFEAGLATWLETEHGALLLLPAPEASYLFAIDADEVTCSRLAPESELDTVRAPWMRDLWELGEHSTVEGAEELIDRVVDGGVSMGQHLFTDEMLLRIAAWKRVTFIAPDLAPPMAHAWISGPSGKALGFTHAVDSLPSFRWGEWLATASRRDPSQTLAVVGGDVRMTRSAGLPPVHWDARWVEALELASDPEPVEWIGGVDATLESISAVDWSHVGVLQWMTHGSPHQDSSAGTALALEDGWFGAEHVTTAPLLVLLTACESGRRALRRGDAGASLGRAYLSSGAACVVESRGGLRQRAVERWSPDFLTRVIRGGSPAESLRQLRLELEQAKPGRALAWTAGLRVEGLGHRPLFPPRAVPTPVTKRAARWPWLVPVGAIGTAFLVLLIARCRRPASSPSS